MGDARVNNTGLGGRFEQSNQILHQQFQQQQQHQQDATQRMFAAALVAAAAQPSMMQANINSNNGYNINKGFNENRKNQRGNNMSAARDDAFPGFDRKRPRY